MPAAVMHRAQDAGLVRADLAVTNLPLVPYMLGCAIRYTHPVSQEAWIRCPTIGLDGLRAHPDSTPMVRPRSQTKKRSASWVRHSPGRDRFRGRGATSSLQSPFEAECSHGCDRCGADGLDDAWQRPLSRSSGGPAAGVEVRALADRGERFCPPLRPWPRFFEGDHLDPQCRQCSGRP
jgi:hypothetical protein